MNQQSHHIEKALTGKVLLTIFLASLGLFVSLLSSAAWANAFGINGESDVSQQIAEANPMPTVNNAPSLAAADDQSLLAQATTIVPNNNANNISNNVNSDETQIIQGSASADANLPPAVSQSSGIENALPNYPQQSSTTQSSSPSLENSQATVTIASSMQDHNDPLDNPSTGSLDANNTNMSSAASSSDDNASSISTPPPERVSIGDTSVSRQAFLATVRNLMPLSPDQIKALRYLFDQSQRAASTEPGSFPPEPTSSAVIVNLSPGATPPVIRLRAGFITSLVFLDSTGQPWPISAYDLGNPKSFNIQWDQKSNTLMVQALDSYQTANLAVMLKDQNTPVMLTLLPGQQQVDYRVDLRVPGLGPNASAVADDMPGSESPKLLDFLNGTPPAGSQLLRVSNVGVQAWLSDNHLYLRTRLTVLSPGWLATMSSPDGTHVYELVKTPVVLASSRGKIIQLRIEGL